MEHLPNPRLEEEKHHYSPRHQKLLDLGLQPRLLSDVLLDSMLAAIRNHAHRIRRESILPRVQWDGAPGVAAAQIETGLPSQRAAAATAFPSRGLGQGAPQVSGPKEQVSGARCQVSGSRGEF